MAERSRVMFYEEGVERFRLVGFDEEVDKLFGEADEIILCAWLKGKQGGYIGRGGRLIGLGERRRRGDWK